MENQVNKNMAIEVAKINKLKVLRKTDIGYILSSINNEDEQVFMHNNDTNDQKLNIGDNVDAFIYIDSKKREAATLKTPFITKDEYGLLEVVDVLPKLGVFLNLGVGKDVLLSVKELPLNFNYWPERGDFVLIKLTYHTQMLAKLIDLDEYDNPNSPDLVKTEQEGYVAKIVNTGVFIVLKDTKDLVFIKKAEMRQRVRLGQLLEMMITYKTRLGYQATLVKQKEEMIDEDAKIIIDYLKRNDGVMPFTANTDSDTIIRSFKLSRKAFKRALGYLYRERIVYFEENETFLNKEKLEKEE